MESVYEKIHALPSVEEIVELVERDMWPRHPRFPISRNNGAGKKQRRHMMRS